MGQYERESTRNRPESVSSPISLVYGAMNMYLVASEVEKLTDRVLAAAGRSWPPQPGEGGASRQITYRDGMMSFPHFYGYIGSFLSAETHNRS